VVDQNSEEWSSHKTIDRNKEQMALDPFQQASA
jgi:hypothetical protein